MLPWFKYYTNKYTISGSLRLKPKIRRIFEKIRSRIKIRERNKERQKIEDCLLCHLMLQTKYLQRTSRSREG